MSQLQSVLAVHDSKDPERKSVSWELTPDMANTGFREGGAYEITKPQSDYKLLIDDEFIDGDDHDWHWQPGFYAGQVRAELLGSRDRVIATYTLDVSPHPGKLGKDLFQAMLDEIWEYDPTLVLGTEPAQVPIGHEGAISDPWLEYARLRAYVDHFLRAIELISRRPIRELRAHRLQVPLQYVRRADRRTAFAALRIPQVVAALGDGISNAALINTLPLFDIPVTEETLDGAANRCIAAITRTVTRRAKKLRKALELAVAKESDTGARSDLASRWPRRRAFLDRLITELHQAQRVSPISDVTRLEISAAGLNAVSADPNYARAYSLGWRILRHGVEGPPDAEQLWISPTWEIYERWCFVRLCRSLQKKMPQFQWNTFRKHRSGANAALVGTDDNEAHVELLLQPKFPAGDAKPRADFNSISGRREPDIVLTKTSGDRRQWFVLDAKYRTARSSVLDAMSSAHIYRDALRFNGDKPELAVLLVPRTGGAPWLEQLEFISTHGVGVFALDADTDLERIWNGINFVDWS